MKKRLTVALVMPVLNEAGAVTTTLNSVYKSTRLPDEILIADGGSTDNTLAEISEIADPKIPLRVFNNPAVYAGAGRNIAVNATKCDLILLVDFGNTIDPEWIEHIAGAFESDPSLDAVNGAFYPVASSDYEHCVAAICYHAIYLYKLGRISLEDILGSLPKRPDLGALSFACTREVWLKLGGMPAWLRSAEDKLFCLKLVAQNAQTRIIPKAILHHHMRSSPRQIYAQNYVYNRGNGKILFFRRHVLKVLALYSVLCGLIWLGITVNPAWLIAAAGLFGLYTYHAGLRKVIQADTKLNKASYIYLAPMVLFPRDIGIIMGQFVGLCEWAFIGDYRSSLKKYLSSLPKNAYTFIQRG